MSNKTKMYRRSHIRDRKKQETEYKLTRRQLFLKKIESQSNQAAFIGTNTK